MRFVFSGCSDAEESDGDTTNEGLGLIEHGDMPEGSGSLPDSERMALAERHGIEIHGPPEAPAPARERHDSHHGTRSAGFI